MNSNISMLSAVISQSSHYITILTLHLVQWTSYTFGWDYSCLTITGSIYEKKTADNGEYFLIFLGSWMSKGDWDQSKTHPSIHNV
jgi:hypothetical protein